MGQCYSLPSPEFDPATTHPEEADAISVIVRTWNERVRFSATLDAVLRQDSPEIPFEVVCVDSGSVDGSREVALAAAARDPRVRLVDFSLAEFSYGRSLNFGARAAKGDPLVFLSQDATPTHRRWLSELTAPLRADPTLCATFGRQIPRPHDNPVEAHDYRINFGPHPRRYLHEAILSNANAALPRSRWEELPFDESLPIGEDRAWAAEQQRRGFQIAYLPQASVYHSHDFGFGSLYRRAFTEAQAQARLGHPRASLFGQWRVLCANLRVHAHVLRRDRRLGHHGHVLLYRFTQLFAEWRGHRAGPLDEPR